MQSRLSPSSIIKVRLSLISKVSLGNLPSILIHGAENSLNSNPSSPGELRAFFRLALYIYVPWSFDLGSQKSFFNFISTFPHHVESLEKNSIFFLSFIDGFGLVPKQKQLHLRENNWNPDTLSQSCFCT